MVLRIEKKLIVIEQPTSPAPPAESKYLRSGMRFMVLIMRLLVLRLEKANKKSLNAKGNGKGKGKGNDKVVARYVEFLEKNLISQEVSGRVVELKEIQNEDTSPSENTSEIHMKVEGFEPPQEEVIPVRRTDMDGNVHTYKARLVAKGSTQSYVVDYEETFSPVANIRAIRILIAMVTFYDYDIWQMDKSMQPLRSIYGLKRASKSWNKRFDEEIKRFGFAQNVDEPCVYQKASGSNVTFPILYVDDIIIMGNHIPSLQSLKTYLGNCYVMKDLGEATFILGIKIYRDRSKRLIELIQSAYMDKILKRYRMDTSKRGYIPM
nr:retrotransposon protein, putative, Ty1-copia subclass [Tanacetum cinerariifolium]